MALRSHSGSSSDGNGSGASNRRASQGANLHRKQQTLHMEVLQHGAYIIGINGARSKSMQMIIKGARKSTGGVIAETVLIELYKEGKRASKQLPLHTIRLKHCTTMDKTYNKKNVLSFALTHKSQGVFLFKEPADGEVLAEMLGGALDTYIAAQQSRGQLASDSGGADFIAPLSGLHFSMDRGHRMRSASATATVTQSPTKSTRPTRRTSTSRVANGNVGPLWQVNAGDTSAPAADSSQFRDRADTSYGFGSGGRRMSTSAPAVGPANGFNQASGDKPTNAPDNGPVTAPDRRSTAYGFSDSVSSAEKPDVDAYAQAVKDAAARGERLPTSNDVRAQTGIQHTPSMRSYGFGSTSDSGPTPGSAKAAAIAATAKHHQQQQANGSAEGTPRTSGRGISRGRSAQQESFRGFGSFKMSEDASDAAVNEQTSADTIVEDTFDDTVPVRRRTARQKEESKGMTRVGTLNRKSRDSHVSVLMQESVDLEAEAQRLEAEALAMVARMSMVDDGDSDPSDGVHDVVRMDDCGGVTQTDDVDTDDEDDTSGGYPLVDGGQSDEYTTKHTMSSQPDYDSSIIVESSEGLDAVESTSDEAIVATIESAISEATPTSMAPPTPVATPELCTPDTGNAPPPGIAVTGPDICEECDEERARGWVNEEVDEGWYCAECWSVFFDDDATSAAATVGAAAGSDAAGGTCSDDDVDGIDDRDDDDDGSDDDDGFDSVNEGSTDDGKGTTVPRQHSDENVLPPVTYIGNALVHNATMRAAATAIMELTGDESINAEAEFHVSDEKVSLVACSNQQKVFFVAAASGIQRVSKCAGEHVALFVQGEMGTVGGVVFCHIFKVTDESVTTTVLEALQSLIETKQSNVRHASMSAKRGRAGSFRYAKKSAAGAPNARGGPQKKMYSFKRRSVGAEVERSRFESASKTPNAMVDMSQPIGMYKCTYLGCTTTRENKGHAAVAAAIAAVASDTEDERFAPTPVAVVVSRGGIKVVDIVTSEELRNISIAFISFISTCLPRDKVLKPFKLKRKLLKHGWDAPVLGLIRQKSLLRESKSQPICDLFQFPANHVKKMEDMYVLLQQAMKDMVVRSRNIATSFLPPPGEPVDNTPMPPGMKEVKRDELHCLRVLGKGQFGEVFLATWSAQSEYVAVKIAQGHVSLEDASEFLGEAELMAPLVHPNIVQVLGVAIRQKPWLIVLEFCDFGDLRNSLQQCRKRPDGPKLLNAREQLYCAYQIASAMDFIGSKRLIHMDLATRNCLLQSKSRVKVADFGVAQLMAPGKTNWRLRCSMKLPGRWQAPESLAKFLYSPESDCWAFGVVCYEIASHGKLPYADVQLKDVKHHVLDGGRCAMPAGCDADFWRIAESCYKKKPQNRPSFASLMSLLKAVADIRLSQYKEQMRDIGQLASRMRDDADVDVCEWITTDPVGSTLRTDGL
eukprot:m.1084910 g.1084910  ORF g.1084910 m.1084910 type:complete len:1430 (-) comp24276_c0_seq1:263-4552(-)